MSNGRFIFFSFWRILIVQWGHRLREIRSQHIRHILIKEKKKFPSRLSSFFWKNSIAALFVTAKRRMYEEFV